MVRDTDVVLRVGRKYDIDEALSIYTSKIYVNHWVGLKYRFATKDSCSHMLSPDQTYKLLKEYKRAVLVIGNKKEDFKKALVEMEQELIKEGYHKSVALVNEPCSICKGDEITRPAFEPLGIDIISTVRKFKKNISQPKNGEYPPYGIILVG
jgi:predicted metal-binding protein